MNSEKSLSGMKTYRTVFTYGFRLLQNLKVSVSLII